LGTLFDDNNEHDITTLNNNINKVNQKIKITNERIDILSHNVSDAISNIKNILEKINTAQYQQETFHTIVWNLDQLINNAVNIRTTFKLGEITISLLESNILNHDLLNPKSLQKIIDEGLKFYPDLEFPLRISKYTVPDIIKLIDIQKIGQNNFIMLIPLVRKNAYNVHSITPHPVLMRSQTLILADIKDTILTDNTTYIITDIENMHSINNMTHILRTVEPIWGIKESTCEWEGFKQNVSGMLELCNYQKVGTVNGTYLTETKYFRLMYLAERQQVDLDCPDGKVRDHMLGLHKIHIQCDVRTNQVYWPARQTKEINVQDLLNDEHPSKFDTTQLPIWDLNITNRVHVSIKKLIDALPSEEDAFTFDFDKYDFTLEEVQAYTIIAYGSLSILVIINSVILGILIIAKLIKWRKHRSEIKSLNLLPTFSPRTSFSGLRDSIRYRKSRIEKMIKQVRPHSPANSLRSLRSSLRKKVIPSKTLSKSTNTDPIKPIFNNDQHKKTRNAYPALPSY
jgi:hypothetical protein